VYKLITNDPAARLGEVEGVHRMRVAVRRLRSDLRMFSPVIDEDWSEELLDELNWLGDALGSVRDADVLVERLRTDAADLGDALRPLFNDLEKWHTDVARKLEASLNDGRYTALLDRLVEDAQAPNCTPAASRLCRDALPGLVERTWRNLARKARRLRPNSADADLHAVRILDKRVRYASELAAKSLRQRDARAATRFARKAEVIQNILGTHQDTVTARVKLEEAASRLNDDPALVFALGRLAERENTAGLASREQFFPSWKAFDQKGIRSWLSRRGSR
jgi:CHAD domain-containing protein